MIKNYEIKKQNNEEVLYLYLDFSLEFAKMNPSKEKTTINKEIDKYIKKNKIKFNGRKIMIMASGLLLGTCLLKSPLPKNYDNKLNNTYATSLIINEDASNFKLPEKIEIKENIKEEIKTEEKENISSIKTNTSNTNTVKKDNNKNTTTKKEPTKQVTTNKTTTNTNKTPTNTPNKVTNTSTNTTTNKTPPKVENKPVVAKTMVTVKRSNGSIINIELEEYIIGVVAAEMPASFHSEALKAQAIAARTYALKAKASGITLTDTVSTQAYKDNKELKQTWGSSYNTYYNKVKNAVLATQGLVIKYNGSLINAYYHSTSNGFTEDSSAVFGAYPYLKSVSSPVDKNVSSYLRTVTFTYENISNKLGVPITPLSTIKITKNKSNRTDTILIDNNTYSGVKFRTLLGLRSTDFDIVLNNNNISITTRGYGHGVGMSQYGAHEYAKTGWSYSKILKHYYSGITISKY